MSGVRCVWANIPEAAESKYKDEYVPDLATHGADHALHCEVVKLGLETTDAKANLDSWRWLTVYESKELKDVSEQLQGLAEKVAAGPHSEVQLDVRTYDEFKCWQDEEWDCDYSEVASVAVMEWSTKPGREQEVLDFYTTQVAPAISNSEEVLRFRLLKIRDATGLDGAKGASKKEDTYVYLTLVELCCDEWPWDVVVALGAKPKWREFFEQRTAVDWRSSHYLVEKVYPVVESDDESEAQ